MLVRVLHPTDVGAVHRAAIWHNPATGQPVTRSLIVFDH
jgi:hypothetical protein